MSTATPEVVAAAPLLSNDGKVLASFAAVEAASLLQLRRFKRTDSSMAEQLSKNVTKILEDLLKDYDKTERPSFKTGKMRIEMIAELRRRPKFYNIDLSCIILSQQGLYCLSMVSLLKNFFLSETLITQN